MTDTVAAETMSNQAIRPQSVDEMIESFNKILASDDKSDPVPYCWAITDRLLTLSHTPQQVFSFGKTALQVFVRKSPCLTDTRVESTNMNILNRNHGSSFYVACVCYLLATACFELQRYDECSGFLDWAEENLTSNQTLCDRNCVRDVLLATHAQLYNLKMTVGKRDEAVVHVKKGMEIKELMMEAVSFELVDAYVEAYEACFQAMDVAEALSLCLKALEISTLLNGEDSVEVALLRVDLGVFYYVVEEYEKADVENQLWESVLKDTDISDDLTNSLIKRATRLTHLGRCEEGIQVLQAVVSRNNTDAYGRVISFVSMAKASCMLGKVDDAKASLLSAVEIISEGSIIDLIFLGSVYVDMSVLYENMKDFETAVSMLKRGFEVSESRLKNLAERLENIDYQENLAESLENVDPQTLLAEGLEEIDHQKFLAKSSRRLFSLISLAGREEQEIPYMRGKVEILEKSFGREHIEVGYGCAKLGAALSNFGQEAEAVKFMENARNIMDFALGPHHVDSLRTSHTLSEIYGKLGRFEEALEIQKKVTEDGKGLEPSEQEFLDKAAELLNKMKERVAESATRALSQTQEGKDVLSAEKSDCGTSGDGAHPPGGA